MTTTINDILQEIRLKSLTEREKGADFERLMKLWFLTDPRYADLEKVWLWEEFPARKDFGGKDLGIDLVARTEYGDCRAEVEKGKLYAFNYIHVEKLQEKVGLESTISVKNAGNYMFVMDSFFKVLVIIGRDMMHKTLNYSDIIEVSYVENGDQLFTKSTGRTVGGAIVGGVLMGGAGAVVGGLSGNTKQNKVVNNMDIKILLRSTEETTCILHFMDSSNPLKTKEASDKTLYEEFLKNANEAKDLLSVIIDDAKQALPPVAPVLSQPVTTQPSSVADELAKLAKLKADGILTEEEFLAQKAKLLG